MRFKRHSFSRIGSKSALSGILCRILAIRILLRLGYQADGSLVGYENGDLFDFGNLELTALSPAGF